MHWTKFIVKLLIFKVIVRRSFAEIIIDVPESEESSSFTEVALKIITAHGSMRGSTIGIVGGVPGSLVASLSSEGREYLSLILLDITQKLKNVTLVSNKSRYRLSNFVIAISSSFELHETLMGVKNSRWWNHMAWVYVLGSPTSDNHCSGAFEILWSAWRMNLLRVIFVCSDPRKGTLIYSFNPYTTNAPDPWKLEEIYTVNNHHPWALFVRKYVKNDQSSSERIHFKKTQPNIGGHKIRAGIAAFQEDIWVDAREADGIDSIIGPASDIVREIFKTLNATAKLMVHGPENESLGLDAKRLTENMLTEVTDGASDVALLRTNQLIGENMTTTFPYTYSSISIMTQYRGQKSQLDKLLSVVDVSSRIGLGIVCLVTSFFLKYFIRQNLSTAVLNIVRLICNAPITNIPHKVGARIYLTALFVFLVTVQAIYQGQLASLLSKRQPLPNINTLQDLIDHDLTIYSSYYFVPFIKPLVPNTTRLVETESMNCTEYVLKDSNAACLNFWYGLAPDSARFKLHQSSDLILGMFFVAVVREDWPLQKRFDQLYRRASEADLFNWAYYKKYKKSLDDIARNNDEDMDLYFTSKPFTLEDLGFAFVILVIGLALATMSFILEWTIRPKRASKLAEARQRFRGRVIQ